MGTSSTNSSLLQLDYTYGTTANNGNVLTQRILVNSLDVTQTYTYDEVNRLKTAEEKQTSTQTQIWKQAFTFDRYGNRNFDTANTTANVLGANPTISQSNNRFNTGQSYSYDFAGNVTAEPGNKSYTYDGENHQLSFTLTSATTNYSYDGDGRRVRKANPDGTTIVYVYNATGQMLAEYTTGTASGTTGTSYITTDHLGSTRVVTKADGTVRARYDFLPFGEEIDANIGNRNTAGYLTDTTRQKFTGHERDGESGLDFAQARYCSSATGRFMSVDPVSPVSSGTNSYIMALYLEHPKYWNGYVYSVNNPLKFIDKDGKHPILVGIALGAALGGGFELLKQVISGEKIDGQKIFAATISGAISGGLVAATGGGSLLIRGGIAGGAEVIEGLVERTIDGDPDSQTFDSDSLVTDLLAGVTGGVIGDLVAEGASKWFKTWNLYDYLLKKASTNKLLYGNQTRGGRLTARAHDARTQFIRTHNAFWLRFFTSEIFAKLSEEGVKFGRGKINPRVTSTYDLETEEKDIWKANPDKFDKKKKK